MLIVEIRGNIGDGLHDQFLRDASVFREEIRFLSF
jgi:hypothetical protein